MTNAPTSLDLCDRLNHSTCELYAVYYALSGNPGIEMDDSIASGFCAIIMRQIDEIEAIIDALHP